MSNLADIIEEFILSKLSGEQDDIVILRRNEIADTIECAPSQVSYVLSTRFTVDRGFVVESRRGSGGFIRIARIPVQRIAYEDAASRIDEAASFDDIVGIVERLRVHGLLTAREAALMIHFFAIIFDKVSPQERVPLLRSLLLYLGKFS